MTIKLDKLNKTIVKCKKCPRLNNFIRKISREKRKQNLNERYWGKPVPGFGNNYAKILILGLAPAAHGGTRTGRAFTGCQIRDRDLCVRKRFADQRLNLMCLHCHR